MTPSQSRRHHSPRSNKWCVDDERLALVLQMIVSPTLNSLSQDLDLVERRFEWKATSGRLEIKIYVVGMEYLDLNTSVGGSLLENGSGNEVCVLSASPSNERWVKGYIYAAHKIQPLHTIYQSWWDRIRKLSLTEIVNLVTVRNFGGTHMQLGRTDSVRVWA